MSTGYVKIALQELRFADFQLIGLYRVKPI